MKYLVRSFKYFVYIMVIMTILIAAMMIAGLIDKDPAAIFRNGYDSYWQIALMFAAVSLFYPRFGFVSRRAVVPGAFDEIRDGIVDYMHQRGYVLENLDGENMTFRATGLFHKARMMFEDRITFTRAFTGYDVEGLGREVSRIVSGLEYRFSQSE